MIYGTRSSRTMLGEFRARRAAGSRARTDTLLLEAIAALASLWVLGPHPAAQPQIDTSTCQNMNTECCRIMCRQRGR